MKTNKIWVKQPVVDCLVFILPWGMDVDADQAELLAPIRQQIQKAINAGRCERAYIGGRYRENFHIKLDGGSEATVQIGAFLPERQNGGIRIEVNPAKFAPDDAALLNRVMQRIVGPQYWELLKRPVINGIDFAIDIVGLSLSRTLVSYSHAQRFTVFGKTVSAKGMIETYNFGSVSSDYMATVYDKGVELAHAALLKLVKNGLGTESLKANAVKQLKKLRHAPDVVRVEVRGKKMRGRRLSELSTLPNRFARFKFAALDAAGTGLPPLIKTAFLAMCRQDGVKATLAAFKHTEHARQINAYWRSNQAPWWQPQSYWSKACDAVREIGLFPAEAFDAAG